MSELGRGGPHSRERDKPPRRGKALREGGGFCDPSAPCVYAGKTKEAAPRLHWRLNGSSRRNRGQTLTAGLGKKYQACCKLGILENGLGPHSGSVTLGKLLTLSEHQFAHLRYLPT